MTRSEIVVCAVWGGWVGVMALAGWIAGGMFW